MRAAIVGIVTLGVGATAPAYALRDHQYCWRVSDPIALRALVDVTSPQLGLVPGCKLGKATLFCDPAAKSVVSANVTTLPVHGRGLLDPRICYRVHCGK